MANIGPPCYTSRHAAPSLNTRQLTEARHLYEAGQSFKQIGEIYGVVPPEPEPEPPQRRALTPAERQRKRREKIRAEREMQLGT